MASGGSDTCWGQVWGGGGAEPWPRPKPPPPPGSLSNSRIVAQMLENGAPKGLENYLWLVACADTEALCHPPPPPPQQVTHL